MATPTSHNKKSSSVKRILSEARELASDPSTEYTASPLEDNIFEWHYTLRGPSATEFENGLYHGRILLPAEYPFRPPNITIMTPNGRFELNKKICLTFTGFHEEMWQPAWGIRTALLGVQTFFSARDENAAGIGSLDYPIEERQRLADCSKEWTCPTCQCRNIDALPDPDPCKGSRKAESLPEGLTVDPDGGKKKKEEDDSRAEESKGAGKEEKVLDRQREEERGAISKTANRQDRKNEKQEEKEARREEERCETSLAAVGGSLEVSSEPVTPRRPSATTDPSRYAPPPSTPSDTASGHTGEAAQQHQMQLNRPSTDENLQKLAKIDKAIAAVLCLIGAILLRRIF
ncbi:UBC-like protein [Violaceomyces palustris]|uniref:UBC-like protein n=1 Tax=Violaceomyces palustris TaxID=1673888 RepID=A0ACD0NR07_9BASI|nr:UBC-like protein [Violaceomyces palustris]